MFDSLSQAATLGLGLGIVGRKYFQKKIRNSFHRNRKYISAAVGSTLVNKLANLDMAKRKKQTKLNFPTTKRQKTSPNPRHASNSPLLPMVTRSQSARINKTMRSVGRRLVRRNRAMRRARRSGGSGPGYTGAMRRGRSSKVWNDVFNRRGVTAIHECNQEVIDANCVYAFADVIRPQDAVYYAVAAVVRLLMEKAGLRATAFDELVVIPGGCTDIYFNLVKYNIYSTAYTNTSITCTATTTFKQVVDAFGADFGNYVAGFGASSASNTLELVSMSIEKRVGSSSNAAVTQVPLAEVQLGELFIHVKAKSELKIQNRTVGTLQEPDPVTGAVTTYADFSASGVHANPLVGRSYVFSGVPKLKTYGQLPGAGTAAGNAFLNINWTTGINCLGGTGSSSDFKTPVDPKMFWNCKSSAKQHLDPGEMKSLWGVVNVRKKFLKYLQMLKYEQNTNFYSQTVFPIIGVAFEDAMNLNGAFSCTIGMSIDRKMGMYVTERKQKYFRTQYTDNTA